MCTLQVDLLSVTFYLETAEIRWLIVTHFMKIQHFPNSVEEVCYKVSLCENIQQQSCSYIIPLSNGPWSIGGLRATSPST